MTSKEKLNEKDEVQTKLIQKVNLRGLQVGFLKDGWKPYDPTANKQAWYIRELLLGIVLCFTQVPQIVAFSLVANVDPTVGLHATWILGVFCAVLGGRPAMINGSSGSFAAIICTFLPEPVDPATNGAGVEYLFPSVIVAGCIMLIFAVFGWSTRLINIIGSTILIGFCDGLAIVIAKSQLTHLKTLRGEALYWSLLIIVISMIIMEFSPKLGNTFRIFKVLPSALLAIAAGMLIEYALIRPLGFKSDVVGDIAKFSRETSIPRPFFLNTMFDMKNLVLDSKGWTKIFYQGFMLGAIGIIEGLLVVKVVDGFTGMIGQCDRQVLAMGIGNIVAGLLGGMGGTGMIGLSTINGLNGGQGRISSLFCALCVMICIMGAYPILNIIPVASLSGIIFIVVYRTFKWYTIDMVLFAFFPARWVINLGFPARKVNRADVIVILTVVIVTLTVNLFVAVLAGILLSVLIFLTQVLTGGGTFKYFRHAFSKPIYLSKKQIEGVEDQTTFYTVHGPLFFGSFRVFTTLFDPYNETSDKVIIYMEDGRIYDYSSLEALNKVCKEYKNAGKTVSVMNLTDKSEALVRMSSGSNSRCQRIFSVGWILGDISLATEKVDAAVDNERLIKQDDIHLTENTYGYDSGFFTQADPDAFVIT